MSATIAPDVPAELWLRSWAVSGGGTTIGVDGSVTTWWLPITPHADAIRELLDQLDTTAGLKAAVRAEVLAKAHAKFCATI